MNRRGGAGARFCSPPVEARPRLRAAVFADRLILGMLRSGGACVIRQDAQAGADRKLLRDAGVNVDLLLGKGV